MATAQTVPDFGVDVAALPDLDPTFTLQLDRYYVLGEALARRLLTPRGGLAYDQTYGKDLRDYLGRPWTQDAQFGMQQDAERECEQDERVSLADAAATFIPPVMAGTGGSVKLELQVTTVAGVTLTLVLAVTQLTVTLLSVR